MSDDEDDYAFYGTAVEQPDEDHFTARKAPRLEDQTATDKQGRRRFHGAFTGGFSAGHFNTVGSVEGFTPSSFTSSRTERSTAPVRQDAQMFMDDEDLSSHGIAARQLQATADFAVPGDSSVKRKRQMPSMGPIPGAPVLLDLFTDTSNSVGARMLMSLGWKEGQGVGPRLSRQEKRRSKRRTKDTNGAPAAGGSGAGAGGGEQSSDSDDGAGAGVTFAPDDSGKDALQLLMRVKGDNRFGLGYVPLSRDNVLGKRLDWEQPAAFTVTEKKKTITIQGQAFGVGAFEEEDDDIYGQEDMSHYDFMLGGPRGGGGATAKGGGDKNKSNSRSDAGLQHITEVLEGFVLSTAPCAPTTPPPLPVLPPGYEPFHQPAKKRFSRRSFEQQGLGRHDLTHADRQRIIEGGTGASVEVRTGVKGARPPPPPPSAAATQSATAAAAQEESVAADSPSPAVLELLREEGKGQPEGSKEYKPFGKDTEKQKRYDLYLKMKAKGLKDRFWEVQPRSLTEWERNRELQEFEKAAQLYKPLTFAMSTRFVSSSVTEGTPLLKDGLNMNIKKIASSLTVKAEPGLAPAASSGSSTPDTSSTVTSKDPRMNAALAGMFGKMTQMTQDWHPDRLLCKRFNVPPPYPDSRRTGVVSDSRGREKVNLFNCLSSTPTYDDKGPSSKGPPGQGDRDRKGGREDRGRDKGRGRDERRFGSSTSTTPLDDHPEDVQMEEEKESPTKYGLKVPVDGPPTMDLFKAIFQDSSSDSDSSDSDSNNDDSRKETIAKPHRVSVQNEANVSPNSRGPSSRSSDKRARKSRFEPVDGGSTEPEVNKDSPNDALLSNTEERPAAAEAASTTEVHEMVEENPPRHVFISRKKKASDGDEKAEFSPSKQENAVKVSFVKGVKGKKKLRTTVSKSSLSFLIESDPSDEDKEAPTRNEMKNSKIDSKKADKKSPNTRVYSDTESSSAPPAPVFSNGGNKDLNKKSCTSVTKVGDPRPDRQFNSSTSENIKIEKYSDSTSSSELPRPMKLSESSATGIFANIDFVELNRYRERMDSVIEKTPEPEGRCEKPHSSLGKSSGTVSSKSDAGNSDAQRPAGRSSLTLDESSSDSDASSGDAYGAALPPNFVNPQQVIRDTSKKIIPAADAHLNEVSWKEKTSDSVRRKSSSKKEKKNKKEKHKSKSHKKEKKKKHRKEKKKKDRKNRDESSSSDSSS